jgi:hypothetical protein
MENAIEPTEFFRHAGECSLCEKPVQFVAAGPVDHIIAC